jgi:hypothetical protein
MSGMQLKGYRVEDWLAALEREERRLKGVQWCHSMALAACGAATIALALVNKPGYSNMEWFSTFEVFIGVAFIIGAMMFAPPALMQLYRSRRTKSSVADFTLHAESAGIGQRILAGQVTGNEVRTSFPKLLRWLVPQYKSLSPIGVMRRVAAFSEGYVYNNWALTAFWLLYKAIALLFFCLGIYIAYSNNFSSDWMTPEQQKMSHWIGMFGTIEAAIAVPLVLLFAARPSAPYVLLPLLKCEWRAQLEQNANQKPR